MDVKEKMKTVPVSSLIAVVIVVVFGLYFSTLLKTVPCGETVLQTFSSNFIHTDYYHLISNIYALYALSRVEQKYGSKKFFGLIVFALAVNTGIETLLHRTFPSIPCSIGFSGVLFSVTTWELIVNEKLDLYLVAAIAAMLITPSLQDKKVSLVGHTVGAVSGIVAGLLYQKYNKV